MTAPTNWLRRDVEPELLLEASDALQEKPDTDACYVGLPESMFELCPGSVPISCIDSSDTNPIDSPEPPPPHQDEPIISVPVETVPLRALNGDETLLDNGDVFVPIDSQLGRYLNAAQTLLSGIEVEVRLMKERNDRWGSQFRFRVQQDKRPQRQVYPINRPSIKCTVEQRLTIPDGPLMVDLGDKDIWVYRRGWGWGCRLGRGLVVKLTNHLCWNEHNSVLTPADWQSRTVLALQQLMRRMQLEADVEAQRHAEATLAEEAKARLDNLSCRVRRMLDIRLGTQWTYVWGTVVWMTEQIIGRDYSQISTDPGKSVELDQQISEPFVPSY